MNKSLAEQLPKKRSNLLSRAKSFIFSTAVGDSASKLCRLNFQFGLAKMHLVQEDLGLQSDASFISAPDCTISRNVHRWRNGIGYGGKVTWGDGSQPLVFIDTMPNACGMLVGALEEPPDPTKLIQKIHEMNDSSGEVEIAGVPLHWNYGAGNHFINVFDVVPNPAVPTSVEFPPHAFITHSSPSELKSDNNPKNLGFYYHKSERLQELAEVFETPFGDINYLIDDAALKYYEFYKWAEEFGAKRRELAASLLFEDGYRIISNHCHQGMVHPNEIVLGSHVFKPNDPEFYPLTLRADLPCYLMRGIPNFTEEALETLNFRERSQHLGIEERLLNANILPHGGGYTFPHIVSVPEIFETVEKRRYFSVDMGTGIGTLIFESPRELQFSYRGRNVVIHTVELGLGEIVAQMVPRYALKI
ncbi:MAG: hypothetical protein ACFFFG_02095 [Candidatus Thorarchaeota archaeon]